MYVIPHFVIPGRARTVPDSDRFLSDFRGVAKFVALNELNITFPVQGARGFDGRELGKHAGVSLSHLSVGPL